MVCTNIFLWLVSTEGILVSKPPRVPNSKNGDNGEWVTVSDDWGNQKKAVFDSYNFTAPEPNDVVKKNQSTYPKKDKCLIFYHVPKSAGESLHQWFDDNHVKFWSHYWVLDDSKELPPSDRGLGREKYKFHEVDVYMGHWTPKIKETLLSRDNLRRNCYEVTVLRNPLERTASMLFYSLPGVAPTRYIPLLKDPKNEMNWPDVGIRKFYQDARWYFENICRQFSGLTRTWNEYDRDYSLNLNSTCDVKLAKTSLMKMDFVGFVEHIDVFISTIGDMLGLPKDKRKSIQRKNKSENPPFLELPEELQILIRNANKADKELYSWAANTFDES